MSLRDRRFTAKPREERITVPEWDNAEVVVRGMTGEDRAKFVEIAQKNPFHAEAYAIIACVYDPETGKPVYELADRDELMRLDCAFIDRLGLPIMRLSGLTGPALAEMEKNLRAASGALQPSSPGTSESPQ